MVDISQLWREMSITTDTSIVRSRIDLLKNSDDCWLRWVEDQVVNFEVPVNETSTIPRLVVFVRKELDHVIDTRDPSNRGSAINIDHRALVFLGLCPCSDLAVIEPASATISIQADCVDVDTMKIRQGSNRFPPPFKHYISTHRL